MAENEALKLQEKLRDLVSAKLEMCSLPSREVVPCVRTGSAAITVENWRWYQTWSGRMDDEQPRTKARQMLLDEGTKILVVVGPTGFTANPASLLPVVSKLAAHDGLIMSIEQNGQPLVVSAKEVEGGLKLFMETVIPTLADVDKPALEQALSCVQAVEKLKVVRGESARIPGVLFAQRIMIGFLSRRAERLMCWWKWDASLSPDDTSDCRRWLKDLGKVSGREYLGRWGAEF